MEESVSGNEIKEEWARRVAEQIYTTWNSPEIQEQISRLEVIINQINARENTASTIQLNNRKKKLWGS